MKKAIALASLYLCGVVLTYGINYGYFLEKNNNRWPNLNNEGDAGIEAVFSGFFWPAYWPFRLSREMFEPSSEVEAK